MKQAYLNAEIIALQALNFIFENEDYQSAFLENSGISIGDLNADLIKNPETLAAILDFILEGDQTLLGFCEIAQLTHQDVWRARLQLPGSPAEG
ncbi:MAG: DUF3572 family protein [Alphaproteobacteria bacterium]|nr:DUF3572 family protein [Alphaproteobacteria bacterium]